MAYPSQASELRHFLGVAKKLRGIADDPATAEADRELFLTAAAALEARATWMATSLPGDDPGKAMHMHRPVNLLV